MSSMFKKVLILMVLAFLLIPMVAEDQESINANNLNAEGMKLIDAQNFKGAVQKFEAALKIYQKMKADKKNVDKELLDTYSKLAAGYSQLKDVDNTIKYLELKLKMDTKDNQLPRQIAQFYAAKGNMAKVEELLTTQEANRSDRYKAIYRKDIANFYEKAGNKQKQAEWLEKYRQVDPNNTAVIMDLANLYVDMKQPAKATTLYDDYIKTKPKKDDLVKAYKNLGVLYQTLKNTPKQMEAWDNALKLEYDAKIAKNMMLSYYNAEDYTNANRMITLILSKSAKDTDTIYVRAQIKNKTGDKAGAKADFQTLVNDTKYGKDAQAYIKAIDQGQ